VLTDKHFLKAIYDDNDSGSNDQDVDADDEVASSVDGGSRGKSFSEHAHVTDGMVCVQMRAALAMTRRQVAGAYKLEGRTDSDLQGQRRTKSLTRKPATVGDVSGVHPHR
jgi:hypothetical protein